MPKRQDISQIDPQEWKRNVSANGYENGYSVFAIRFFLLIILRSYPFTQITKYPSNFQKWYQKNRKKRIDLMKKYNADHPQQRREAQKRWYQKNREYVNRKTRERRAK